MNDIMDATMNGTLDDMMDATVNGTLDDVMDGTMDGTHRPQRAVAALLRPQPFDGLNRVWREQTNRAPASSERSPVACLPACCLPAWEVQEVQVLRERRHDAIQCVPSDMCRPMRARLGLVWCTRDKRDEARREQATEEANHGH